MTVIRELVTVFGVKFDKGSASKAEAQQKSFLQTAVKAAGFIIAGKKLGEFMLGATNLASSVVENLNVMGQAFGKNEEEVHQWAETFGAAAYRNKYELEKMAAGVGAVLHPMLGGSTEEIAKMSTALTELAIDYSSFRELKDIDVMRAVQAGIVGEIEPLRRLGVVMTQDALNAFALEKGLNKTTREMNLAEKTTLRYNYLMEKSELVTGDAIKTANNYANALKGIVAGLSELATDMGLALMPTMSRAAIMVRNMVWAFKDWAKNTMFLEAVMISLSGILTAIGIKLIMMFSGPLLIMAKFLAIFIIAALVIDDFLVFLSGGKSVIGDFIDSIWGPGSAAAAAQGLKDAWEGVKLFWEKDLFPILDVFSRKFREAFGIILDVLMTTMKPFIILFENVYGLVSSFMELFTSKSANKYEDFFNNLAKVGEKALGRIRDALNELADAWKRTKAFFGFEIEEDEYGTDSKGNRVKTGKKEKPVYSPYEAPGTGAFPPVYSPYKAPGMGAFPPVPNITVNTENNINVAGNASPEAVSKINKSQKSNAGKNVAAISALTQRAPAR